MSAWSAVVGIVARDLIRTTRQTSRLLGGLARPFMWLLLVGTGYNAIARLRRRAALPGVRVSRNRGHGGALRGMLTAIGTVYDREFGMLRLMLASPAGVPAVLDGPRYRGRAGRDAAGRDRAGLRAAGDRGLRRPLRRGDRRAGRSRPASSALLGLLVAARLRSVENFAGVINVVLFPLLFVSGALYPTAGMPPRCACSRGLNPGHLPGGPDAARVRPAGGVRRRGRTSLVLVATTVVAFGLTALLFDPEQRFVRRTGGRGGRRAVRRGPSSARRRLPRRSLSVPAPAPRPAPTETGAAA